MEQLLTDNHLYYLDTKPDAIYRAEFDQTNSQWRMVDVETSYVIPVTDGDGLDTPFGAIAEFDFICEANESAALMIDLLEKWRQDWRDMYDVVETLAHRLTNQYMTPIEMLAIKTMIAENSGGTIMINRINSTN